MVRVVLRVETNIARNGCLVAELHMCWQLLSRGELLAIRSTTNMPHASSRPLSPSLAWQFGQQVLQR